MFSTGSSGNRPVSSNYSGARPNTAKQPARKDPTQSINMKINKRKIPATFYKDPEAMYMELQQVKQEVTALSKENLKLKTQIQKVEQGRDKKEKQVEELLKAHAIVETKGTKYESLFKEVSLMKRLKLKVKELEKELQQRDEEFNRIRLDSRFTRVKELETEMKTYYSESRRLQTLVDQMQLEREQMMSNMSTGMSDPVISLELQQLREKNAKFRDLVMKMKQMQDHLKEQNDLLSEQLRQVQEGNDPVDNTQELQHFKYENEKLLNQREKLRNDYATLLEQSKNANNEISVLNRQLKQAEADINNLRDEIRAKSVELESLRRSKEEEVKEIEHSMQIVLYQLEEEKKLSAQLRQSIHSHSKTDTNVETQSSIVQDSPHKKSPIPEPTRSNSPHLGEEEEDDYEEDQLKESLKQSVEDTQANITDDDEVADLPEKRQFTFDDDDEDPFLEEAASLIQKNSTKFTPKAKGDTPVTKSTTFADDDSFDREMEAEFGDY